MQKASHRRILQSSVFSYSDIRWDKKYHYKFYSKIVLKGKNDIKSIAKEAPHIKSCSSLYLDAKKASLKSLCLTLDNMKFFAKTMKSLKTDNFSQANQRSYLKKLLYSSLKNFNFWIEEAAWKWFLLVGRGPKTITINFPRTHPQRGYPLFIELVRVLNYFTKSAPVNFKALSDDGTFILDELKEKLPQWKRKMHFEFETFPDDKAKIEDYAFLGESNDLYVKTKEADESLLKAPNFSQIKELTFLDTMVIKANSETLTNLFSFKLLQELGLDLKTEDVRSLYGQLKFPKKLTRISLRIEDMGRACDEKIPTLQELNEKCDAIYTAISTLEKEIGYCAFLEEIEDLKYLEDVTFGISYDLERQHPDVTMIYAFCKRLRSLKYLILENNMRSDEPEDQVLGLDLGIVSKIIPFPEKIRRIHLGINRLSFEGYDGYKFKNLRKLQTMTCLKPKKENYVGYIKFIEDLSKSCIRNLTNLPYLGDMDFNIWKYGEFKEMDELFLVADEFVKSTETDIIKLPDILKYKRKLRTFYFAHEELNMDKGKLNQLKKGLALANYLDKYEIYLSNKQLISNR